MRIAVVVLNYKGWQDTKKCLAALRRQTYTDFEIYLIDNGSGDDSVKELSKIKMKNLHFHKEPKNTGLTGGVNIGIKWAMKHEFEAVALLNNDANAEPGWLEELAGGVYHSEKIGELLLLLPQYALLRGQQHSIPAKMCQCSQSTMLLNSSKSAVLFSPSAAKVNCRSSPSSASIRT